MKGSDGNRTVSRSDFIWRVVSAVGIVAGFLSVALFLWFSLSVLLLIFAGLLVAILLDAIASKVTGFAGISRGQTLALILIAFVSILSFGSSFYFPVLSQQLAILVNDLPRSMESVRELTAQYTAGRWMLEMFPPESFVSNMGSGIFRRITGYMSSAMNIIVDVAIVSAIGIYFAFSPGIYREGLINLFPVNKEKRVREVLITLHTTLSRWLAGRLTLMAINAFATTLGLWFLGVPAPILLGLIAGFFNFIPNVGPFIAAVPAVLIAFTQGPEQALYVALLFLIVQNVDGFVLTPLIQKKSIELPPVLVLSSQLFFGVTFGFTGLLLAVPIVAVLYVLVRMLYVEDILGRELDVMGEDEAKIRASF